MPPAIEVAPESPPVVLGIATTLKRAAAHPATAKRLGRMRGTLVLRSSVDRQAATVRFARDRISLAPGIAPDADVTITLDFNDPAAKPSVAGAARHPLFALAAAKVLEPPAGTWQDEARRFWTFAAPAPRMPAVLRVVCTDDGSELRLGNGEGAAFEIHGGADALVSVFSGASIYADDLTAGKLRSVGTFEHVSVITGRSIAWAMGEGR